MIVTIREVFAPMAWTIFEILINGFQAFLVLRYIKGCFRYARKTPWADAALWVSFCAYFSLYLFCPSFPLSQQWVFLLPLLHAVLLSSEPKGSMFFWLLLLVLIMNLISVLTYPIFDLLPLMFAGWPFSLQGERFLCILVTNLMLLGVCEWMIRIKRACVFPRSSSYIVFILALSFIYLVESAIYRLYLAFSHQAVLPFFAIYLGLLGCILLLVFLFHTASMDAERENRYQAEISMLNLSRQHQQELAQLYEELTELQHDYKHHLQALEELVASDDHPSAQSYLHALIRETPGEEVIVTGSPAVDALLAAKRKLMRSKGIQFVYSPYPLADLPISTPDFCSIVGNLLDNAIEGTLRMPDLAQNPERAVIHLSFSRSWDMFYMYCENPCTPSTIVRKKGRFVSSKQNCEPGFHGIGLHSIDTIVSGSKGRTQYLVKNQMFYAKVVLPYLNKGGQDA